MDVIGDVSTCGPQEFANGGFKIAITQRRRQRLKLPLGPPCSFVNLRPSESVANVEVSGRHEREVESTSSLR